MLSSPPPPPPDTPARVLVVDDNRDAADSLSTLLHLVGFVPVVRYDPASALSDLDAVRPDACVLDLMMPGLDGLELARRIRAWAAGRWVPLVAVTALDDDDARRATAAAGFHLHLVKPVPPDELAAAVADLVILGAAPDDGDERTRRPADSA